MNIQQEKIKNIILFFANKSSNKTIGRLKLIKLVWLSDRLHLNKYGRLISKDNYLAMPHGPVASMVMGMSKYSLTKVYNVMDFNIQAEKEADEDFLSKSDIKIMDYVWEKFGSEHGMKLRNYSHKFPEWLRFEKNLEDDFSPNSYDMVIEDFFEKVANIDFEDLYSEELIELSKVKYQAKQAIQKILR